MKRTERFSSLAAFLEEKQRLAAVRDRHAERLGQHWAAAKDKAVRRRMMGNALKDTVAGLTPVRLLGSVLGAGAPALTAAWSSGSTKSSWTMRAALLAMELVAPGLVERLGKLRTEDVLREVGVSVDRIRDHLRSRNRAAEPAQPPIDADDPPPRDPGATRN